MNCEKCDTAGSILRRSWDAKGGLLWLCQSCWRPKPASVPAVRVWECPLRAFGATQGDVTPLGGVSTGSAGLGVQDGDC